MQSRGAIMAEFNLQNLIYQRLSRIINFISGSFCIFDSNCVRANIARFRNMCKASTKICSLLYFRLQTIHIASRWYIALLLRRKLFTLALTFSQVFKLLTRNYKKIPNQIFQPGITFYAFIFLTLYIHSCMRSKWHVFISRHYLL